MIEVFVIDAKEVAKRINERMVQRWPTFFTFETNGGPVTELIAEEIAKAQEPPKTESVGEAVARRMFDHTLRLTDVGFIDHDACGSPLLKWFRIDRTQFPASCPYIQDAGELLKELRRVVAKAIDAEREAAKKEEREACVNDVAGYLNHAPGGAGPPLALALIETIRARE